jgi:hypothetical protein
MKPRHAAALTLVGWHLMVPPAMAMNCAEDSLSEVSGSGAILEMLSGQIYKVDDVNQVDSALWLPTEDVLVCTETKTFQGNIILTKSHFAKLHVFAGRCLNSIGP